MNKYRLCGKRAEELYVQESKDPAEIAEITGVSLSAINNWVKKYRWNEKRLLYRRSERNRLDKLYAILDGKLAELEGVESPEVTLGMLQEVTALIKAVNQMRRQYSPGEVMVYSGEFFVPWLKRECEDEDLRKQIYHFFNRATDEALKAQDR